MTELHANEPKGILDGYVRLPCQGLRKKAMSSNYVLIIQMHNLKKVATLGNLISQASHLEMREVGSMKHHVAQPV